jgi:hypothetical protein
MDAMAETPELYLCRQHLSEVMYCEKGYCSHNLTDKKKLEFYYGYACTSGVWTYLPQLLNATKIKINITREETEGSVEAYLVDYWSSAGDSEWSDECIEIIKPLRSSMESSASITVDIMTDFGEWILKSIVNDHNPFYINGEVLEHG